MIAALRQNDVCLRAHEKLRGARPERIMAAAGGNIMPEGCLMFARRGSVDEVFINDVFAAQT